MDAAPTVVVAYDPAWPAAFAEIRSAVAAYLPDGATVEHVGSTAVPGLAAKPVVDVDVVIPSAGDVAAAVAALTGLGYAHRGDLGIAGREAFAMPDGSPLPYHHLYVVVAGSGAYLDHVDLRDHLRRHPEDAARYAAEKRRHAHLLATDRDAYTEAKAALVTELLARARSDAPEPKPGASRRERS